MMTKWARETGLDCSIYKTFWRRRLALFLCGAEHCLEALTASCMPMRTEVLPDGRRRIWTHTRWWLPHYWLAWFRTMILGDPCGSANTSAKARHVERLLCEWHPSEMATGSVAPPRRDSIGGSADSEEPR